MLSCWSRYLVFQILMGTPCRWTLIWDWSVSQPFATFVFPPSIRTNKLASCKQHIDRTLGMTSYSLTNAGKHLKSNVAGTRSQQYSNDSVFNMAQTDDEHQLHVNYAFYQIKHHYKCSDRPVVDTSIWETAKA